MTTPEPSGSARRDLADGSDDVLVREEPLVIRVQDQEVLTMRTPGRDADLAVGFLASEGVLGSVDDVVDVRLRTGDPAQLEPDECEVVLRDELRDSVRGRLTRTHEIRSSCGICGLADPDQLLEELPPLLPGVPRLGAADVESLRTAFEGEQELFAATGACHAAALYGGDGNRIAAGEDVGRHNALDKAFGQAWRAGRADELPHAIALLSGRAGFDLVLKCLRLRVGVVLSVSAPSALSHDLCRAAGATLVGFVRPGRAKVYCDGGRWLGDDDESRPTR